MSFDSKGLEVGLAMTYSKVGSGRGSFIGSLYTGLGTSSLVFFFCVRLVFVIGNAMTYLAPR